MGDRTQETGEPLQPPPPLHYLCVTPSQVYPGIRRLTKVWNAIGIHVSDQWIARLNASQLQTYCCQQFAVSRATIHRWPRRFYEVLYSVLTDPRGHEPGFGGEPWWGMGKAFWGAIVMEHLWHTVWGGRFEFLPYTKEDFCRYFRGAQPHSPCHPEYRFCAKWVYHLEEDCPRHDSPKSLIAAGPD